MVIGNPIVSAFCIDRSEKRYGLHVVTWMNETGWQPAESTPYVYSVASARTLKTEVRLERTGFFHPNKLTPVVHTFEITNVDFSTLNCIEVETQFLDPGNNLWRQGGKGSTHIADVEDGGLGDDN